MPHCHPEEPTVASSAETVVWDALRAALPDDAAVFADVRLTDGTRDCRADLVVAVPGLGVAVIAVAGGHVGHEDGVWSRTDPAGTRRIDPVGRAQRAHGALLDHLARHRAWCAGEVRTAYLVAFPFAAVPADLQAAGCPRRLVLDHTGLAHPMRWLRDAFAADTRALPAPTVAAVDDLTECLLGRPAGQGPLLRGGDARPGADLLTQSQAAVLDAVRELRTVEVHGGAGSGKTWLAVEQARRLTVGGARVGLLASSPALVRYLQRRTARLLPGERPAFVGSVDDLLAPRLPSPPAQRPGTDRSATGVPPVSEDLPRGSTRWNPADTHHLPVGGAPGGPREKQPGRDAVPDARDVPEVLDVLGVLGPPDLLDALVVDEAEQLPADAWAALLGTLADGPGGGLYLFTDDGRRPARSDLRRPFEPVRLDLQENLRSTRDIARTFTGLGGARTHCRGGAGAPVRFVQVAAAEAVAAADRAARELLESGWRTRDVALLTTGAPHPEQRRRVETEGRDAYWDSLFDGERLVHAQVLGFQGLERAAVVLALDGFPAGGDAREALYVGLSRARDVLVVCGDLADVRAVAGDAVARRLTDW